MSYSHNVRSLSSVASAVRMLACGVGVAALSLSTQAREYEVEIVKEGLSSPMGIAAQWKNALYFTEVPTPGVPGSDGGMNAVKKLNLRNGSITSISEGEPYPKNVALGRRGSVYWTCQTAGVILKYDRRDGKQFFLPANGLESDPEEFLMSPSGLSVDRFGDVLFTEVPMPGEYNANLVSVSDGDNITIISDFEPAPVDIVVSNSGRSYWTCNTAGVIFQRSAAGVVSLLTDGLESPMGIAVDASGRRLFYTEVPTPGVNGENGGTNRVMELDLYTMEKSVVAEGFPYPADVTVAADGTVYWTCKTAGVIAKGTPKKKKRSYYRWW